MIQYKYFHKSSGYEHRLSIAKDNSEYTYHLDLFESLRSRIEGDGVFAYVLLNNNRVLMKKTKNEDNYLFVHSVYCNEDDITSLPYKYVSELSASMDNSDNPPDILEDYTLPKRIRDTDKDFKDRVSQKGILHTLIDAVLFGDKKIILMANENEAIDYIKAISYVLPENVAKGIGFCINSANVLNEDISTGIGTDKQTNAQIKLWAPRLNSFDYNSYTSFYYVFDVREDTVRVSYDKPQSVLSKLIQGVDITNESEVAMLKQELEKATLPNGEFDLSQLNRIATVQMFQRNPSDLSLSKSIVLENAVNDDYLKAQAMGVLMERGGELDQNERRQLIDAYNSNDTLAQSVSGAMLEYLTGIKNPIDEEKSLLMTFLENDETGSSIEALYNKAKDVRDFEGMVSIFKEGCTVLGKKERARGYSCEGSIDLITTLLNMVNINEIFSLIPYECSISGEGFFTKAAYELTDKRVRATVCAILMISAYSHDGCDSALVDIRIRGMKALVENMRTKEGKTNRDALEFIILVRSKMIQIANYIPECEIDTDLMFSRDEHSIGKAFVQMLVDKLNMEDCLEIYNLLRYNDTLENDLYDSMVSTVLDKLLNIDFVILNVKSNRSVTERYLDFFATLSEEKQSDCKSVKSYLESLNMQSRINSSFYEYRCSFINDCYKTLPTKSKKDLHRDSYESLDKIKSKEAREEIADRIVTKFSNSQRKYTVKHTSSDKIGIWAFFMSVLSIVILLLPSFIQTATLGIQTFEGYIECVVDFIKPQYVFIPLAVYLMDIVSYVFIKAYNAKNRTNINEVKNANVITLFCGILPLIAFALSFVVFYHMSIGSTML